MTYAECTQHCDSLGNYVQTKVFGDTKCFLFSCVRMCKSDGDIVEQNKNSCVIELVFRSWRTLIGKKRIAAPPPPGAVRGQYAFSRTVKFWRENFWTDLDENKRG